MRQFKWDKKYLYWGITAFCVIAASLLFYMALNYLGFIGDEIKKITIVLAPFIWGFIITYLLLPFVKKVEEILTPLLNHIDNKVNRKFAPKTKKAIYTVRLSRGISVFLGEIVFIAIVAMLFYMLIPQLVESINNIIANSNFYLESTTAWLESTLANYPEIEDVVMPWLNNFNEMAVTFIRTTLLPSIGSFASSLTSGVISAVKAIYNLIIGIIVSCYILASYEQFSARAKKLLYSIFSVNISEKVLYGIDFVDKTFMSFITGKLLDSLIIAIICYVGCAIIGTPYTLLVSAVIGVTNIIPFFGPFIGLVPTAFLILLVDPLKSLIFVIFIIILQQIDGNLIGPKILGNSVGITGFNVMFAIIVGAGLFGFWGMLFGVPVFVVIYNIVKGAVNRKLRRSGLPVNGRDYVNIDHIDPDTLDPVEKGSANSRAKRGAPPVRTAKPKE